ncbi:hypothetical protein [Burkholderia lata]|uniref:hypothetical protein n=1 Tax=Burkholderia lata (strain ATCC 17760 / DSM 23089 / LMG 22485 / NCIMB 9086 / R18194 / 383) TaxID=482957 RepID=UPI0015820B66|nr:hypothetical protein [Burkholderia lata]
MSVTNAGIKSIKASIVNDALVWERVEIEHIKACQLFSNTYINPYETEKIPDAEKFSRRARNSTGTIDGARCDKGKRQPTVALSRLVAVLIR